MFGRIFCCARVWCFRSIRCARQLGAGKSSSRFHSQVEILPPGKSPGQRVQEVGLLAPMSVTCIPSPMRLRMQSSAKKRQLGQSCALPIVVWIRSQAVLAYAGDGTNSVNGQIELLGQIVRSQTHHKFSHSNSPINQEPLFPKLAEQEFSNIEAGSVSIYSFTDNSLLQH